LCSPNNTITSPTCNSNNTYGIYLDYSSNNIINNYSGTGNSSGDIGIYSGRFLGDFPCAKCQHFKTAGVNKCFYEYGITERDTANARGGSGECLKYTPTSATYYINQSFFSKQIMEWLKLYRLILKKMLILMAMFREQFTLWE